MKRPYLSAIAWTLLILAACSIPGRDFPDIEWNLFRLDKLAHFILFLVFGWLWLRALSHLRRRALVRVGLFGIAYAIFTEVYQGVLPFDRNPDPLDALANLLGLFSSMGLFYWTRRSRFLSTRKNIKE